MAAEALTKAIQASRRVQLTKEHRLDELIPTLAPADPWVERLRPPSRLSDYSTAFRYPTPTGKLKSGLGEAVVLKRIQEIRQLVEQARAELLQAD